MRQASRTPAAGGPQEPKSSPDRRAAAPSASADAAPAPHPAATGRRETPENQEFPLAPELARNLISQPRVDLSGASLPAELRPLIGALLGYLAAHPQAKDSIDGVHGWWLSGKRTWSRRQVKAALDHLVKEDLLEALDYGGRKIYHLRHGRAGDLERALAELQGSMARSPESADG